jgi:hypothetical protein
MRHEEEPGWRRRRVNEEATGGRGRDRSEDRWAGAEREAEGNRTCEGVRERGCGGNVGDERDDESWHIGRNVGCERSPWEGRVEEDDEGIPAQREPRGGGQTKGRERGR